MNRQLKIGLSKDDLLPDPDYTDMAGNERGRFYRAKDDGMGIGLPLSRSIVENQRGRLL
jgi:hypothetical protein